LLCYPGQIPFETDELSTNRYSLIGMGMLALDLLGSSTVAAGLACTPTSPGSLNVLIAPGRLYSLQNVDNTAYSSLPADTAHQILKQGILADALSLPCPAPATFGFSTNYLIQAAYQDTDANLVPLPFYNATNPTQAFSGPGNNNTAQATVRKGAINITTKAGTSATTGNQTTPAPDSGFVGLYVVTVANGQTSISAGNISILQTAPFFTPLLAQLQSQRIRLQANTTFYVATSGSDTNNTGLTSSSPWATAQHAVNVLQQNYDLNGFTATIFRANGTYNESVSVSGQLVGQNGVAALVFTGSSFTNVSINSSTPGSVYSANSGAAFTISNHGLSSSAANSNCLAASGESQIQFSGCNFGTCNANHISASYGSLIVGSGSYAISGGAIAHMFATGGASIIASGATITLAGASTFSLGFAAARQAGFISFVNTTFTGTGAASGARYDARTNGVVDTSGGGATYLPGNANGVTQTGGQYA
jgi:hypothetical protein